MWTVVICLSLGVLHSTASSSLPSPFNVFFSSVNLKNVLHWSPGDGTPDDTHFTVQYAVYGDSMEDRKGKQVNWRAVRLCTRIARTWCDLSNETWDQEQGYHARVRAVGKRVSSKWALTQRRFDPKLETTFGPPLVSVDITDNTAIITLKGPMRYQPDNHAPVVSMATFYPQMTTYNLSIYNAHHSIIHHFLVVSDLYKYPRLDYNTEYCFSARMRFLTMPVQCRSSEWHCITTPQDPVIGQLQRIVVGIVVPSLCICALVVVGYFLCNYLTGKGQKSPYILNLAPFYLSPLVLPDVENTIPITVVQRDTDPASPPYLGNILQYSDPPPRFSPQRPGTPSEHHDESIDYGAICEVRNNLTGKCQRCAAGDSYEKKEWRVEDGLSSGFYAPHVKPSLPLKSTHICTQANMPIHTQIHAQTERNTLAQKNSQTGPFHIPFNQTNKEAGMREDMGREVRVTDEKLDAGVEEGSKSEKVPLLRAYASQNTRHMPHVHSEQSDFLPDDYGLVRSATSHSVEEEDDDNNYEKEEEEEVGTICINWDPKTRKLLLPEVEFTQHRVVNKLLQGEEGSEDRMGEGDEGAKEMKGKLRLENVFVRQPSEEEAEILGKMGEGGATGTEVDDFVTKWNLVIPLDQ